MPNFLVIHFPPRPKLITELWAALLFTPLHNDNVLYLTLTLWNTRKTFQSVKSWNIWWIHWTSTFTLFCLTWANWKLLGKISNYRIVLTSLWQNCQANIGDDLVSETNLGQKKETLLYLIHVKSVLTPLLPSLLWQNCQNKLFWDNSEVSYKP